MRILHVISSLNLEGGGPSQGLRNLASFYKNMDVKADVLSFDDSDKMSNFINTEDLRIFALGEGKGMFSYQPKIIDWLKKNRENYDAVVVHGLWQYHSYGVYKGLKDSKIPYYIFPHGMLDPWFKSKYPLKHLKKQIYWWLMQYPVLKNARGVLFTCEEEKILARKSFFPYSVREIVTNYGTRLTDIANNSSSEDFYLEFPKLRKKRIFLYLSRIHEKKGCDLLIKAFKDITSKDENIQLVIAGPDQVGLKKELEELAQQLNISTKITWTGMLKNEKKWGALKAAEVFILPSHQENFGISVAEALAVGTPVLISNKVNIWREIKELNAGLVEDDTLEGTKNLLNRWFNTSEKDKKIISENTTICFKERFDIEQASKNLITLIRNDLKLLK